MGGSLHAFLDACTAGSSQYQMQECSTHTHISCLESSHSTATRTHLIKVGMRLKRAKTCQFMSITIFIGATRDTFCPGRSLLEFLEVRGPEEVSLLQTESGSPLMRPALMKKLHDKPKAGGDRGNRVQESLFHIGVDKGRSLSTQVSLWDTLQDRPYLRIRSYQFHLVSPIERQTC